ncbi:MAG: hypothetical protein IH604_14100 [Burkholderiales bacterium]|nr:hypothetical protein [Burkholderiales bacterium]
MALTLPKLTLPALSVNKKQLPAIVGGVVVLAAAGWFGWQYFAEEPPPPPPVSKPQPVTAAKPVVKAKSPAEIEKERDKLIEDVLAASGLKRQLDQLPQTLASGVRQSGKQHKKAPPARVTAVESALAEAFAAGEFHRVVSADLKKNFDEKQLQALLKNFSTPAAKTMVELEGVSVSPEERAKFARSAAGHPSPQRMELIKRIDAATGAGELAGEIASVTMKTLATGIAGENARKAAAIDKTIEKQRASTEKKIHDETLLNLAYSFKDSSDADLEKFAGISEAASSKWLYGVVYKSLLEEIENTATDAAKRIGELSTKPATTVARSKTGQDARACLGRGTNTAIIKCAEAYR